MGDKAQILPGTLDLLILKAVSLGPLHGYGVLLRIAQISGSALLIEQGALYPALSRLVRQGMLKGNWGTSDNNRRAKFYQLTPPPEATTAGSGELEQASRRHSRLPVGSPGGSMRMLTTVATLATNLFRRQSVAAEMEEELEAHIALRADDLVRSGLCRAEAERRARIEFGARGRYQEASFAALGGAELDIFLRDLRYAVRVLRKTPGFPVAAVITLAMAIGANALVFGLLNALILRPLNVRNPKASGVSTV